MTQDLPHIQIDRRLLMALIMGSCVAYSGLYAMPLWIGALTDHLSLNPAIAGYMGSVQLLTAAAAAIWVSGKINIYSAMKLALVGTLVVITANLASAFTSSIPALFFFRGLSGIGEGLLLANLNVTLSRTEYPDKMFALSQTTIALFGISLFLLAPLLMQAYGVIGVFGFVAGVGIVALLTVGYFPSSLAQGAENSEAKASFMEGLGAKPLLALGILFVGCQGGWAYLERMGVGTGLSVEQVGKYIMTGLFLSLLGPLAANRFSAWAGRRNAIALGLAISASAVLLASQQISAVFYMTAAALFPFGTLFIVTSYLAHLAHVDHSGKMVASAPAFINLGGAMGPALMGGLLSVGGFPLIGAAVAVTYVLALVLLFQKTSVAEIS